MSELKRIRNIGIFAHVDAGKTTLTEQMLLHSGAIRTAGSVDKGTAHTDNLPVEQRRGISVRAACVQLEWQGIEIHLIDTPGHADFMSEIERASWALDGAVLVISAVEGVQAQTELLFYTFRRQGIPMILFINKIDREGADPERVLEEIHHRLSVQAVRPEQEEELLDVVSSLDDEIMERWLTDGEVPQNLLLNRFHTLAREGEVCPVLAGSALKDQGVEALLDAIVQDLPAPKAIAEERCGIVYALAEDSSLGQGAWVRLFSGMLENRQPIGEARITQIRDITGRDIGRLGGGEIGIVYGAGQLKVGDVIGDPKGLPRRIDLGSMGMPLMTMQVRPQKEEDREALRQACLRLSAEDPLLSMEYIPTTREIHLHIMGHIHQEILEETLKTRFGLEASFEKPTVIYKETIAKEAVGVAIYTMPKPCWAILYFRIEPGERGSGVVYESNVGFREIPERYQHQVEQALPLALKQGRQGWEVTDVRITLIDGGYHHIHTHPLDFIVATPWAIQDGLEKGGSRLLEPVPDLSFDLPEEAVGRVMSDVSLMRGEVLETVSEHGRTIMKALVPAASCMDYSEKLAILTGGRGDMSIRLHGYQECDPSFSCIRPRTSVDPLDTSKYILAARSALNGNIFE